MFLFKSYFIGNYQTGRVLIKFKLLVSFSEFHFRAVI